MSRHNFKSFFILLISLLILSVCNDNSISNSDINYLEKLEKDVYRLINEHRSNMGLSDLEWSEIIAVECRAHSSNMANNKTINHDGFYDRIKEKISIGWAGENVAQNWNTRAAVTSWLNSPGHKNNIESNSNLTGVGIAFDADSAMYLTQIFVRSNE